MYQETRKSKWVVLLFVIMVGLLGIGVKDSSANIFLNNNQRTDWSYAGVPGGVPNRTSIYTTLTPTGGNDTTLIQNALNAAGANQVVKLNPGVFHITSTISIPSNKVLRGSGSANDSNRTTISFDSATAGIFLIGTAFGLTPWSSPQPTNWVDWTGGYTDGTKTITVSTSSGYSAGDMIILTMDNAGNSDVIQGDCTWYGVAYSGGTVRNVGQMAIVESIPDSTHITLKDAGVQGSMWSASYSPKVAKVVTSATNAGIEDLYIDRTVEQGTGNGYMIQIGMATYSWIKNVEAYRTDGKGINFHGAYRCTMQGSYIHHAWTYASGGRSYLVTLQPYSSDNLIENNIVYAGNACIIFETSGPGNVIGYNYLDEAQLAQTPDYQMGEIGTHCATPHYALAEGNQLGHIWPDNIHGNSAHFTFFRNSITSHHPIQDQYDIQNMEAIEIRNSAYYFNAIGNVLNRSGDTGIYELNNDNYQQYTCNVRAAYKLNNTAGCSFAPTSEKTYATFYRHGNYNYITNSIDWDSGNPDHTIPNSLYLSSKPSWYGGCTWPPVNPISPTVADIPAKLRYNGQSCPSGDTTPPAAPTGVIVN